MRYVVTGGAGHTGSAVVKRLAELEETELVVVADVRPAPHLDERLDSELVDMRDVDRLTSVVQRRRPDVIVHLACSHDASQGREAMYETNVVGTNGVLAAAAGAGTEHVLVISSAACYANDGSGSVVTEAATLLSNLESDLARDRATVDRLCQLWAARQTDHTMTIVRPCAVIGSSESDATARLFIQPPFPARMADPTAQVQFLHGDDFVEALVRLASGGHGGAFNLAGDGTVSLGECAEAVGLKSRRGAFKALSKVRKGKGGRTSFEDLDLLVSTPAISTERLEKALGWRPQLSSREAFLAAMRVHGRLVAGAPAQVEPVAVDATA